MTTEQRQELSIITEEAVQNNDVETLREIWKVIQDDLKKQTIFFSEQTEWFESLLTGELHFVVIS